MKKTYEEWLKYYENVTKEQVIFDMMLDMQEIERLNNKIEDLKVLIELIYHEVFLNDEQQKLLNSIIIGGDKE